jgi:hypothetical protein
MNVDRMFGEAGADTFEWGSMAETGIDPATVDRIDDFSFADGDRIDVSDCDANAEVIGNQTFTFIGIADYSGAGQIRVVYDSTSTYLAFSTDSDPDNDAVIRVWDVHSPTAAWFVL